jgi:hypothetical protein
MGGWGVQLFLDPKPERTRTTRKKTQTRNMTEQFVF